MFVFYQNHNKTKSIWWKNTDVIRPTSVNVTKHNHNLNKQSKCFLVTIRLRECIDMNQLFYNKESWDKNINLDPLINLILVANNAHNGQG